MRISQPSHRRGTFFFIKCSLCSRRLQEEGSSSTDYESYQLFVESRRCGGNKFCCQRQPDSDDLNSQALDGVCGRRASSSSSSSSAPRSAVSCPRIASTNEIDPAGFWPWMASWGNYERGARDEIVWRHSCGATLISRRHAITAAHCYKGRKKYVPIVQSMQ